MKIQMGDYNTLKVSKILKMGAYLKADSKGEEEILLPTKQLPEGLKVGDSIRVFVYRDSEDRPIATTNKPLGKVGDIVPLKAVSVAKIGAFMDWGLEKDLFLPIKEMTYKVVPGHRYPVAIYLDKSGRLCATSRIFNYLQENTPYKVGDEVEGIVYNVVQDIGAFVVVNSKYSALIPKTEAYHALSPGDSIKAKVVRVLEDGKLTLTIKKSDHKKISSEAHKVLSVLQHNKGFLPLNDDSSPEAIKLRLGMSKSLFKKALGNLLRAGRVEQTKEGMRLKAEGEPREARPKSIGPRKPASGRPGGASGPRNHGTRGKFAGERKSAPRKRD